MVCFVERSLRFRRFGLHGYRAEPARGEALPVSNNPPATDRGVISPLWYSFDLTHRRIQDGGWTRQVTVREFPSSPDIAGVTMRLTAGTDRCDSRLREKTGHNRLRSARH